MDWQFAQDLGSALRKHQWAKLKSLTRHGPYMNVLIIERYDGYWKITVKVPKRKYKNQASLEAALKRATFRKIERWGK